MNFICDIAYLEVFFITDVCGENLFKKNKIQKVWEDDAIGKELGTQAGGPSLDP